MLLLFVCILFDVKPKQFTLMFRYVAIKEATFFFFCSSIAFLLVNQLIVYRGLNVFQWRCNAIVCTIKACTHTSSYRKIRFFLLFIDKRMIFFCPTVLWFTFVLILFCLNFDFTEMNAVFFSHLAFCPFHVFILVSFKKKNYSGSCEFCW